MKLMKLASVVALSALFALNTANAETKSAAKTPAKTQQKATNAKKTTQNVAKKAAVAGGAAAATASAMNASEKRFYNNVEIKFLQRGAREQNGQAVIFNQYQVTNKSKSAIKGLFWQVVYTINDKPVFFQDVNLSINKPYLGAKKDITLDVVMNFNQFPAEVQQEMVKPNVRISSYVEPKSVVFGNDFKIEVTK